MIKSKLISIDTDILSKVTKDYFCRKIETNERAEKFISHIVHSGDIPFFSFHHVEEILQYENEKGISERWSLIKKFPIVAWLCDRNERNILGSILDIHELEILYLLSKTTRNYNSFLSSIKNDLIQYSSGEDFVNQFESLYGDLREFGFANNHRHKEIESLNHVSDKKISQTKLSELNSSRLRPYDEVLEYYQNYTKSVESSLIKRGDPKLKNHSKVAQAFVGQVRNDSMSLYENCNTSPLDGFLDTFGVKKHQIKKNSTVGDLEYLAVYNSKMLKIAENLSINADDIYKLSPNDDTLWVIWREFDKKMKSEKYAHGSNMTDKYLSVFSLFVDTTIVDKRVFEYFTQFRQKYPEIDKHFNKVIKLSNYRELSVIYNFSSLSANNTFHGTFYTVPLTRFTEDSVEGGFRGQIQITGSGLVSLEKSFRLHQVKYHIHA